MTWVTEIPALITTVEQNTHDYLMRELLAKDYYRWQATLSESLSLDAYANDDIAKLVQYGQEIVKDKNSTINAVCQAVADEMATRLQWKLCPKTV